jgi:hypothetical protein
MALSQPNVPSHDEYEEDVRQVFHLTPPANARCGYCGESVAHPCLYWNFCWSISSEDPPDVESDAVIYLHLTCATRFVHAILSDVIRADKLEAIARKAQS